MPQLSRKTISQSVAYRQACRLNPGHLSEAHARHGWPSATSGITAFYTHSTHARARAPAVYNWHYSSANENAHTHRLRKIKVQSHYYSLLEAFFTFANELMFYSASVCLIGSWWDESIIAQGIGSSHYTLELIHVSTRILEVFKVFFNFAI